MVTIFQVANSLLIFQQQYPLWHNTENRWKVIIYNHVKLKKNHVTKRRFPNYLWFHPPVLQGPFTRWVNNKLKLYTSHLYLIHSIILKSTLLYPISQNALRSWWQQPLGKTWVLQCQKGAMTHISRYSYTPM